MSGRCERRKRSHGRQPHYTPYAYVLNNPMLLIDTNGLTDYKYDKETGEVTQVGESNDDPDRIVKTYNNGKKKGEVKTYKHGKREGQNKAVSGLDNIAKGILSDGMNFKIADNGIFVNGEGQPKLGEVEDFLVAFSDYIYSEMSGVYLQAEGESEPHAVYIDENRGNDEHNAKTSINSQYVSGQYWHTHFHTHITRFDTKDKYPSQADRNFKRNNSVPQPISGEYFKKFIILSDLPEGQAYPY